MERDHVRAEAVHVPHAHVRQAQVRPDRPLDHLPTDLSRLRRDGRPLHRVQPDGEPGEGYVQRSRGGDHSDRARALGHAAAHLGGHHRPRPGPRPDRDLRGHLPHPPDLGAAASGALHDRVHRPELPPPHLLAASNGAGS